MNYLNAQENNDINIFLSELPIASEPLYKIKYIKLEKEKRENIISFYSSKIKFIMPILNEFGKRCNKFVKNTMS